MNTSFKKNYSRLKDSKELPLYILCLIFGLGVLALLAISIIGIFYALFFFIYFSILHMVLVGHIRGGGVKVGPEQFPHIYKVVEQAAAKLGMEKLPEVYIMQQGGSLNAFATRFVSRKFIVLFSDLIEACGTDAELSMIVGHELAHLKLGHLGWTRYLTIVSSLVPFLYPAYSRARERSCDAFGYYACGDLGSARKALMLLSVGKNLSSKVNFKAYQEQADDVEGDSIMTLCKFFSMYPFLTKRIMRLEQVAIDI